MKPYIIKCDSAVCCCRDDRNFEQWYYSDLDADKRFALDFNTDGEAQRFIDEYDLCEASEYMDQSMPKICKRDEWIKAEEKQLKLF